jgi:hypothetical protein
MAPHVHRNARMGPQVLINDTWYKSNRGRTPGSRARARTCGRFGVLPHWRSDDGRVSGRGDPGAVWRGRSRFARRVTVRRRFPHGVRSKAIFDFALLPGSATSFKLCRPNIWWLLSRRLAPAGCLRSACHPVRICQARTRLQCAIPRDIATMPNLFRLPRRHRRSDDGRLSRPDDPRAVRRGRSRFTARVRGRRQANGARASRAR